MNINDLFHGPNSAYIVELYDKFLNDPDSVDPNTRKIFEIWKPEINGKRKELPSTPGLDFNKVVGTVNYAHAIRAYGHLDTKIDPLGYKQPGDPSLNPSYHGLSDDDLIRLPSSLVDGHVSENTANALEATEKLKQIYCSTIGYDYDHIHVIEEREWLRMAAEIGSFRPPREPINQKLLLESLTQVEVFEQFLHRIFPGKFRFSIEGVDTLVPMLNEIVAQAAESDIGYILIGMAHRGRLNVMHHVMNKFYKGTLIKFRDPVLERDFKDDMGWMGDVKYHEGARHAIRNGKPIDMVVTLTPNPSHLESVNPVVEGMTRAAGTTVDKPGPPIFDPCVSVPILIHGDAAFPGQGINAETLNLSRLPGYNTGGTIHIITNNQLGYTTLPSMGRSTLYASDLAKGFEIPIAHVNADDPEACIETARLAFAYLRKFQKDFLIDLVGYRRYGHNEADEPGFTQPLMYQKIDEHPTVREIWANTLIEKNVATSEEIEKINSRYTEILHKEFETLSPDDMPEESKAKSLPSYKFLPVKTSVPADELIELNNSLLKFPKDFNINTKLKRAREKRTNIFDDIDKKTVDWATAEELAFASILADGTSIRLTGQDTERGTFSNRHDVYHDTKTGEQYLPLQNIPQAKAAFEIHNSPLSENACIGFEYGYNIQEPGRLVLWEAQYGDFINEAQTIIDEYLVSARAKWGQTPSLVLLLPHAYEGQGPDHSSARVERFLDTAAEINIRIANCTTSAQYFHLLRRHTAMLKIEPLPLVLLTPKSLLRNPNIASSLRDLSEGEWQPIIDDPNHENLAKKAQRLIICSGKIYIDLVTSEYREHNDKIAIVRIEQLYPFRGERLKSIINSYTKVKEIVWVQEEPENMGAWKYIYPKLRKTNKNRYNLHYIGRRATSSPSEGILSIHKINQTALVKQAFMIDSILPNIEELGIKVLNNL